MRNWVCCFIAVAVVLVAACGQHRETAAPGKSAPPAAAKSGKQAAATATAAGGEAPPATGDTSVGSMMPAYTAQTLDGKPYDLASERGNVVLLNLWATWCAPCRFEIPELQKMHDSYAARGFKVVGVSLDDTGAATVRQFVTEHKMTYPIVVDPEGKLANIFQTSSIPTTVVIDRKGKIVWKQLGAISASDVTPAIEAALNAKS